MDALTKACPSRCPSERPKRRFGHRQSLKTGTQTTTFEQMLSIYSDNPETGATEVARRLRIAWRCQNLEGER